MKKYRDIDAYIAEFPEEVQALLQKLRSVIRQTAPGATEAISYGIPTFRLYGSLVHFAGYKNHIGFYPGAAPLMVFKEKLGSYKTSKGTVQFPITEPIPFDLVTEIVLFRVQQNKEKDQAKKKIKSNA